MSDREARRRNIGFGKEQFPLRPSRRIKQTQYVTCQHCGFAINTATTALSKQGPEIPQEGVGCPQCGSTNWAPFKRKLKDASETNTKRSDRRRLR